MQASAARQSRAAVVAALQAAGCVFAEDEAGLLIDAARTPDELAAMVARRVAGLPIEHVLGWARFCGLRIVVEPGVFVPRRRSEFLVRQAAVLARADLRTADRPPVVIVDLCCGSGAVGAALVATLGRAELDRAELDRADRAGSGAGSVELHAVDIDPAAVRCARRNVPAGGRGYQGDLYEPLPAGIRGRVDLLVANAPYVPTEAVALLPPEARDYEPKLALDGGADGLDIVRRVAAGAPEWLAPGGHLLVETSVRQAPAVVEMIAGHELTPRAISSADLGATVVCGTHR
jgi:release factor glutamine methyltransferase